MLQQHSPSIILATLSPAHSLAWPLHFLTLHNTNVFNTEHARLKDHVAGMEGGLEAKVHEGGKPCIISCLSLPDAFHRLFCSPITTDWDVVPSSVEYPLHPSRRPCGTFTAVSVGSCNPPIVYHPIRCRAYEQTG